MTVSHAIVILLILTCQLTPKSNSHISHSFVASVYKAAFFQCLFSSSMYSNVTSSTRINILQCTYVHLRLFYLRVILQGFVDPIMQQYVGEKGYLMKPRNESSVDGARVPRQVTDQHGMTGVLSAIKRGYQSFKFV